MISKLSKQINLTVSFHDVQLYPELVMVKYHNGYGDACESWLISKKGYLNLKDNQESQDPDYWFKNFYKFDQDGFPLDATQIFLINESFLNDPKAFWGKPLDDVLKTTTEEASKISCLYPVYLDAHNYQAFDINKNILRLPLILEIYCDYFLDFKSNENFVILNKIKKHLEMRDDVINVKIIPATEYSSLKIELAIKTNKLPINPKQKITPVSVRDKLLFEEDYFDLNQFKTN